MFYLLTPQDLDAPDWKRSTYHDAVQVEATNEEDARIRAETHFGIATKVEPGAPTTLSTWGSRALVKAKLIMTPDPEIPLIGINDKPQ